MTEHDLLVNRDEINALALFAQSGLETWVYDPTVVDTLFLVGGERIVEFPDDPSVFDIEGPDFMIFINYHNIVANIQDPDGDGNTYLVKPQCASLTEAAEFICNTYLDWVARNSHSDTTSSQTA